MDRPEDDELSSVTSQSASLVLTDANLEDCGNFAVLSDEIILKILKELDAKSLIRFSQVNKYFGIITKDPFLWTRIDIGYRRSQQMGRGLCFDLQKEYGRGLVLSEFFKLMMEHCKFLHHLSLTFSCDEEGISKADINNFVKACCGLLTYLNLTCNQTIDNSTIAEVSLICNNLKELKLSSCSNIDSEGFQNLEKLHCLENLSLNSTKINTGALCSILQNNQQMRYLRIDIEDSLINLESVAEQLATSCPYIECIVWFFGDGLTSITLEALERCTNLRKITFHNYSRSPLFREGVRRTLFTRSSSLKTFDYMTPRGVNDDLEPLLDNHLEELSFTNARITPDFCSRLLKRSPQLKSLQLTHCSEITYSEVQKLQKLHPRINISAELSVVSLRDR